MAGNPPGAKMALDLDLKAQKQDLRLSTLQQQQQAKTVGTGSAYEDETPRPPASTDRGFDAVTPGIQPSTYQDSSLQLQPDDLDNRASPSYFSRSDPKIPPRRPLGVDGLLQRRVTTTNMGRRESLSEIRASHPDLALSGNIISATFNIPHAFTYRKGGDWVS